MGRSIKRRSAKRHIKRRQEAKTKTRVEFLGSGCTTANLALSGTKDGGWARGRILNLVGDGSSGKTLKALELAFWCFNNLKKIRSKLFPRVKKIIIVYNNREGVMDFPLEKMYGPRFVKAVEWVYTATVEKMGRDYARRLDELESGEFLLYIVDSLDALDSVKGMDRFGESVRSDSEIDGSYHLEKQKYLPLFFSNTADKMEKNKKDATLMIISQVRTKIGITFGKKSYRTGGKSMDFYTHQVAWLSEVEKLRATRYGDKKVYGIRSRIRVERSKVSKPYREAEFTILFDHGLDDVGSMVEYLWRRKCRGIDGEKFKSKVSFIEYVEDNDLEEELQNEVERIWDRVEEAFRKEIGKRKSRW